MPYYESVFIARQDASTQQVEALTEKAVAQITEDGGKVTKIEPWGLRSLSYRIKKNRKGHYVLLNIDAPAPAVAEFERQLRLNEDVLRFMTLRVDALEDGPSAIVSGRGERGDRGDRVDRGGRGDRGDRGDRGERRPRQDRDGES